MSRIIKYFYVIEFFFFSGTFSFSVSRPKVSLVIWLVSSIFMLLVFKKKVNAYNWGILSFITFWILTVQFITTTSSFDNTYMTYILFPAGCLFGLSQFEFEELREKLLTTFSVICFTSIIAQLVFDFLHVPPVYMRDTAGMVYTTYFYIFNLAWGGDGASNLHRMSSIFWEPGQFQIVCFFILCLFTDKLTEIKKLKDIDIRFLPIFLGIIYSQSTMGYIILSLFLFVIVFFRKKHAGVSIKTLLTMGIILSLSFVAILAIMNSDVVQNKIEQRDNVGQANSYNIRMMDNLACLQATLDSPIFGLGINSKELTDRLISYGNTTSSNGWLYTSACLGIPYIFVFFLLMYKRLREMPSNVPRIFILAIIILAHCNEAMIFFPYVYLYIFRINNRKNKNLLYNK